MPRAPRNYLCPACAQPLRRSPRNRLERQAEGHRRWRCAQAGCGWVGLLPQPKQPERGLVLPVPKLSPGAQRLRRQGLLLGLTGLLAAAATAAWLGLAKPF